MVRKVGERQQPSVWVVCCTTMLYWSKSVEISCTRMESFVGYITKNSPSTEAPWPGKVMLIPLRLHNGVYPQVARRSLLKSLLQPRWRRQVASKRRDVKWWPPSKNDPPPSSYPLAAHLAGSSSWTYYWPDDKVTISKQWLLVLVGCQAGWSWCSTARLGRSEASPKRYGVRVRRGKAWTAGGPNACLQLFQRRPIALLLSHFGRHAGSWFLCRRGWLGRADPTGSRARGATKAKQIRQTGFTLKANDRSV